MAFALVSLQNTQETQNITEIFKFRYQGEIRVQKTALKHLKAHKHINNTLDENLISYG